MKGLVGESENVNVLYINGKPATKYVRKSDAEKDAAILRAKFPDKKIELKQEMDEARQPHPLLKAANKNLQDLASGEVRRREEERRAKAKRDQEREKQDARAARPKKPSSDQIWQKVEYAISNYFPDGDPTDYLNPYMQKTGITWDDITRAAKKNGYKDLWDYWNTLTQDIENDAYADWHASGGKSVRTRGTFLENKKAK